MAGLNLSQKRADYSLSLERALDEIIQQVSEIPEIKQVILFGSYQAGRRDLFTDLDLIVVMKSEQGFIQRTADLYGRIQTGVDLDLLVYTPEEFNQHRDHGFLRHALENGQVIYEKKRA